MTISPEYVLARRVLLDFLEAMGDHCDSLILVGSQSLYFHIDHNDLEGFPLYTNDGDVILDTTLLSDDPRIEEALQQAGFTQHLVPGTNEIKPGSWHGIGGIPIDVMVTRSQSNRSKATARTPKIPPHHQFAARTVDGLEGALLDYTTKRIAAYESEDTRSFEIRVAGPTALLIAKLIKVQERYTQFTKTGKNRLQPKDSLDLYRLLSAVDTPMFVTGITAQLAAQSARPYCLLALEFLSQEGTHTDGAIIRQLEIATAQHMFAKACITLVNQLLADLESEGVWKHYRGS